MNIAVIGTGFVGLTHAAVCAEAGHRVIACDIDPERVAAYASGDCAAIEQHVNEPGLAECVAACLGKRLLFTTQIASACEGADVVFMCLPTPPQRNGSTDSRAYLAGARQVARALARHESSSRVVVANKSTVPIGTARALETILAEHGARNVGVASNPEFLPQGSALRASRRPDRVVLGADCPRDLELLRRVYAEFSHHPHIRYVDTTPESAEAIKYVSNALLMTYISFWNGVGARLAEEFPGVQVDALKQGVTADARISSWGSYVGNGAGGSCFGKDILSLIHQLESKACSTTLLRAVHEINEYQKNYLIERAVQEAGYCFNNKTVALIGLAFKRNTNDMRDSSSLRVIESLLGRGVRSIRAHDPWIDGHSAGRWLNPSRNHLFARISYHSSMEEALRGSDVLFISTDWEEFRGVSRPLRMLVEPPYLIIDGRRMISDPEALVAEGYEYLAVGSALLRPEHQTQVRDAARHQAA